MENKVTYTAEEVAALEARLAVLSRDNEALASENAALAADAAEAARRAADAEGPLASRVRSLESERDALAGRVAELEAERDELAGRVDALQGDKCALIDRITAMNAERWKPRSERGPKILPGQAALSLFNDVEAAAEGESADPAAAVDETATDDANGTDDGTEGEDKPRKARKKGKKRAKRPTPNIDDLEVTEVVDHVLDDLECPVCGAELEPMLYESSKTLVYVPARLEVIEHRTWKYVCRECYKTSQETGGETKSTFVRAEKPALPLPGSIASASLLAHVLEQKYMWAMPINRIWRQLADMGLPVCRQTLCQWVINTWEWLLEPFESEVWRRTVAEQPVLQVDETTVQVLREPDRTPEQTSYMWVAATGELCAERPAAHFEYHPSRKYEVARELLGGFRGHVVSDGYGAYDHLWPEMTNSRCGMHMRRGFAKFVKAVGEDACRAAGSLALEVVGLWARIYKIEGSLRDLSPEERLGARLERVLPLLDSMYDMLSERRDQCAPGQLRNAVDYSLENLARMGPYLRDGRVPIDNGHAERMIRPFAIGRRNWLFSSSVRGAEASAGIYSIVATAGMNGLHAGRFLEWLIGELAQGVPTDEAGWDRLMPWSESVPESCRLRDGEPTADADDPIVDVDPEILNPD